MKLHSIATEIGSALLVDIAEPIHPVEAPEGWGLVFWGRSDRATFGTLILSSKAKWIADYDIRAKVAIVMWPPELAGKAMPIDTTCVEAVCPGCGSSNYVSNGVNWQCKDCGKRWRKGAKRIRSSTIAEAASALTSGAWEKSAIDSDQFPV